MRPTYLHRILTWLFLAITTLAAPAQPATAQTQAAPTYNMDVLDMRNGLPNNFVDDIYQDSYGFIWICTRGGGLVRYDGFTYDYIGGATASLLSSHSSKNVVEDPYHRLWIAYDDYTGVMSLNTMRAETPPCATPALARQLANALRQRAIRVYRDSRGQIWLATQGRLFFIAFNALGQVAQLASMPCQTSAPDVAMADIDGDGHIWFGCNDHVGKLFPNHTAINAQSRDSRFAIHTSVSILALLRHRGRVWMATNNGIYLDDDRKTWIARDNGTMDLSHNFVNCLATLPDGSVAIGTLAGIDIYRPGRNALDRRSTLATDHPLTSNFINCILVSNGQIWVGTESGGIDRFTPRLLNLVNYVHEAKDPSSLSPNCVNAMYVQHDGTLWVGTVEGGLNRKAAGSGTFTHFTTANSGLTHNSVSTLTADTAERTLWVGTWGGGLCVMDMAHPETLHRKEFTAQDPHVTDFIGALAVDSRNQGLWVGSSVGLFFYDFRTRRLLDPFPGNRAITGCIGSLITRDGQLFIGCLEGMVCVDLKSRRHGRFAKPTRYEYKLDEPQSRILEKIQAFCQGRDGTLWLGSNGYGLYRATKDAQGRLHFKAYTRRDGLPCNAVKGIVEDHEGYLWVTTENGLAHFDPKTETFDNFTQEDGLLSNQFYFNSAVVSSQGVFYLGSDKGLTALYGISHAMATTPHLRFTRLIVDNEEATAGSPYLEKNITSAKTMHLHEGVKSFTIEFSALNYGFGHEGTYSYRMKGYENNWIRLAPGQHSVRYSTLPPGNYEFEVAYTGPQHRGTQHIGIAVTVTPYFYKSWWFVLLMLALLALAAYRLYRHRLRVMRDREVERLYRPIELAMKESENPDKLQSRIQTILANQNRYVESVAKTEEADRKEIERNTKPFLEQVMAVMETNYDNPEFGGAQLCEMMGMGRGTLSKKLGMATGMSTTQFIRNYRLDIACRILMQNVGNRNISEIAFKVGFNDPKYFTRCFTKHYGVSPSAYNGERPSERHTPAQGQARS